MKFKPGVGENLQCKNVTTLLFFLSTELYINKTVSSDETRKDSIVKPDTLYKARMIRMAQKGLVHRGLNNNQKHEQK